MMARTFSSAFFCWLLCHIFITIHGKRCYYNCPMEGTMVDLSQYPSVTNKTGQLERFVSMHCQTTKSAENLKWLLVTKDEVLFDRAVQVTNDSRYRVYDNSLAINRMDVEHKGVYVCTTKHGRVLSAFFLDMNDDPPVMHKKEEFTYTTVDQRAHLECHGWNVREETTHTMNWTFNGELIFVNGTSLVEERFNFWGWSLTISNMQTSDKGAYRCYIDTKYNILQKVTYVEVYEPPTVYSTIPSGQVEIIEGTNVAATCKSASRPPANIRWTISSHYYGQCRDHLETVYDGCELGEVVLIKNFSRSCDHAYICEARNEIFSGFRSDGIEHLSFSTAYKPEVTILEDEITSEVGATVTIACKYYSRPVMKPKWIKDGAFLNNSDKYDIREGHYIYLLTIYNIQLADDGRYSCYVENYVGNVSDEVILKVTTTNEVRDDDVCEPIHIPYCKNLWYNQTNSFPTAIHPDVASQTDLLEDIYSEIRFFDPKPNCQDLSYIRCARHLPPCEHVDTENAILPCRKFCESAKSRCNDYSYNCDGLALEAPCTTPQGIITVDMEVSSAEVEVSYDKPLTITCRVKTNAPPYLLYFAKNTQSDMIRTTWDDYVKVNQTEIDGIRIVQAHYDAFRETQVTKFLCVLKTQALDMERVISVKVSDSFTVTPLSDVRNYVFLGNESRISCQVKSRNCKITDVHWLKYANNPVVPSQDVEISYKFSDNNATIETEIYFRKVAMEHIGSYQCLASNECGETKKHEYIHLSKAQAPHVVAPTKEVFEELGGEAILDCNYKDKIYPNPNVNILWKRGVEVISRDREVPGFMPFNSQLVVLNVTKGQFGNYTCFARNQFGWSYQVVTLQEIPGRAPIVKMDFDVKGKQVVMNCKAYARTEVSISWFIHNRRLIPNERKYRFSEMSSELVEGGEMSRFTTKQYYEHKLTVTIRRFSPEDLDTYSCVASNSFGENSAGYNLTAYIGPPKIFESYSRDVRASIGRSTSLYCYVRYDFRHTSLWRRNGRIVESTGRFTIRSESKRRRTNMNLDISEVRQEDFGSYTCEAENQFGRVSHIVQLVQQN